MTCFSAHMKRGRLSAVHRDPERIRQPALKDADADADADLYPQSHQVLLCYHAYKMPAYLRRGR